MLAQKPSDGTTSASEPPSNSYPTHSLMSTDTVHSSIDPAYMTTTAAVQPDEEALQQVVDIIKASPEFAMVHSFDEYLTSPFATPYDDFNTSPMDDSPFAADLNTPIMDVVDDFTNGAIDGGWTGDYDTPLFDDASLSFYAQTQPAPEPESATKSQHPQQVASELLNSSKLYAFSPSTPALDSFNSPVNQPIHSPVMPTGPSVYPSPRAPSSASLNHSANATTNPSRSRSKSRTSSTANGTRRNITPASMVPLEAPTQRRNYVMPSSTSRKENPIHAQKRSHSQAFGDHAAEDEDELLGEAPPGPNASDREHIEWKRRQNTLAARKSRRRKLEYLRDLETENSEIKAERDRWKVRCGVLEGVLKANGLMVPDWEEE